MKPKQPAGPAMTLGNMRELGVAKNLIASCLNDACRHFGLIDVSKFPHDTEVPSFARKVVCAQCGSRGNKIDVRPKSYANHDAALKEWIRGKTSRPNSSIERRSSSTAICPELNTRSTTPTPVSDWKTRRRSPTGGMKLLNIAHFHRSRLLRLFERGDAWAYS